MRGMMVTRCGGRAKPWSHNSARAIQHAGTAWVKGSKGASALPWQRFDAALRERMCSCALPSLRRRKGSVEACTVGR